MYHWYGLREIEHSLIHSVSRVLWGVLPPLHPDLPPRPVSPQWLSGGRWPTGHLRGLSQVSTESVLYPMDLSLWLSNIRSKNSHRFTSFGDVWDKKLFKPLSVANLSLHKTTNKQHYSMHVTSLTLELWVLLVLVYTIIKSQIMLCMSIKWLITIWLQAGLNHCLQYTLI